MGFKLGNTIINAVYLGDTLINTAYLGNDLIFSTDTEWFRPDNWLTQPVYGPTDFSFDPLYLISQTNTTNTSDMTVFFTGTLTVDWKDGSTVENYITSPAVLFHTYDEADITSATIDFDGTTYKQVMPSITSDSCLLYTSPSPRDRQKSRMPSSA